MALQNAFGNIALDATVATTNTKLDQIKARNDEVAEVLGAIRGLISILTNNIGRSQADSQNRLKVSVETINSTATFTATQPVSLNAYGGVVSAVFMNNAMNTGAQQMRRNVTVS